MAGHSSISSKGPGCLLEEAKSKLQLLISEFWLRPPRELPLLSGAGGLHLAGVCQCTWPQFPRSFREKLSQHYLILARCVSVQASSQEI